MSEHPPGRLAAIDYGTVRIGVAVSNASQTLASPYENYTRRALDVDAGYFRRLVSTESITRFVVGLPVHTDGLRESEVARSRSVRKMARRNHRASRRLF